MRILTIAVLFISTSAAYAQSEDPMDMAGSERAISDAGIVRMSDIDALKERTSQLLAEGDCAAVVPELVELSKQSNFLANVIRAGIEPFYDASLEDRRSFVITSALIDREREVSGLLETRNRAWVDEGLCHSEMGDDRTAIVRLTHALDYIGIDETETWTTARNAIWRIVGVVE